MKKDYVLDILKNSPTPLNAKQIYNTLCSNSIDIDFSTVYRTLNNLVNKDILTKEIRQNKIAYFKFTNHNHKHYLICDKCNKAIPTNLCNIKELSDKIKKETGFKITTHTLELHGLCQNCLKNAK